MEQTVGVAWIAAKIGGINTGTREAGQGGKRGVVVWEDGKDLFGGEDVFRAAVASHPAVSVELAAAADINGGACLRGDVLGGNSQRFFRHPRGGDVQPGGIDPVRAVFDESVWNDDARAGSRINGRNGSRRACG
jgi:hypothetical protein